MGDEGENFESEASESCMNLSESRSEKADHASAENGIKVKSSKEEKKNLDILTKTEESSTPVCIVTLSVEFEPSKKDQKEALFDELNKKSTVKATAIEKLRKSAVAISRAQSSNS